MVTNCTAGIIYCTITDKVTGYIANNTTIMVINCATARIVLFRVKTTFILYKITGYTSDCRILVIINRTTCFIRGIAHKITDDIPYI